MKDSPYTISFLRAQDMPEVHQTFLKAFADYFVPIQLTEEQFYTKLKRESIEPTFCVGAYEGANLVGFILTGIGNYNQKPTGYNAGTGVVPEHRGHGLTKKMYDHLLIKLKQSGMEQCLLEVIQENTPALKSYEAIGLKITRSLDCFRAKKDDLLLNVSLPENIKIAQVSKPDWVNYSHFCDVAPTWQNTSGAIVRSPDEKVVLEARDAGDELVGYAAFFPKTGAIAQFAVVPAFRGEGIGKALLKEVKNLTIAPALMLLNVDTEAVAFISFLKRRNFTRFLGQFEMIMALE
ncbi:GNAT family N-acetyltransferase [Pontibacter burrus]|uniref:GNAT family N-acetyltransferase n=1 Tax=Pontibacter burrus TaxID=2704466 RepID=A0A6B3LTG4_9BACT|nr:GNAT family N-acetyltransferase [Pontibacter burrus]NEM96857.1 GNAT family N-acetyltransferase [Pontibacter burrus]